jgi:hypothetical protein
MWDSPPGLLGFRGGSPLAGAHVDVYEHVVVATLADGSIHVAPLEWCAPLTIKKKDGRRQCYGPLCRV